MQPIFALGHVLTKDDLRSGMVQELPSCSLCNDDDDCEDAPESVGVGLVLAEADSRLHAGSGWQFDWFEWVCTPCIQKHKLMCPTPGCPVPRLWAAQTEEEEAEDGEDIPDTEQMTNSADSKQEEGKTV